jgi:hypothetical protein
MIYLTAAFADGEDKQTSVRAINIYKQHSLCIYNLCFIQTIDPTAAFADGEDKQYQLRVYDGDSTLLRASASAAATALASGGAVSVGNNDGGGPLVLPPRRKLIGVASFRLSDLLTPVGESR